MNNRVNRLERVGKRILPALLFALLVLGAYSSALLSRRNFAGRDLLVYNLPMEKTVHDAYARGQLPVWSPEISGGRPLLPNPNAGALYPLRAVLAGLPFPAAVRVFPILHWIAAGVGTIFLLGSLGLSRAGAWTGGVTYVFSGVGVSEVFYPHIQPGMALLPWILWALARPAASRGGKLVVLSILFGLVFLAGDVFTSGIAIVSCALWALLEENRAERSAAFVLLALAVLLGGLLALPQILATSLWAAETNRGVLGMKLGDSFFFSIHPVRLLELVVPYPLGWTWTLENADVWGWSLFRGKAMGVFSTLYAGAFAVIALVTSWTSRERGARFARFLFVFALLVSVLPSLVPASWERFPSPLPLRNPEKFAVAMTFALALFAGLAFDRLRHAHRRPRGMLAVGGLFCVATVATAVFRDPVARAAVRAIEGDPSLSRIAADRLPAALAEGGLLWVATIISLDLLRRPGRTALVGSLALLTLVLITANRKIARTLTELEMFSPTPFARYLDRADPDRAYRTLGESIYRSEKISLDFANRDDDYTDAGRRLWIYSTSTFWSRGTVFNLDFDVGDLSRVESLRQFSILTAGSPESARLFGSLGLRWGIRFRDQKAMPGYERFGGDFLQDWDELKGALPHVRLVESWREEITPLSALNTIPRLGPQEVVLETGVRQRGRARAGMVRIHENWPERLVVSVEAPDPTWLFVLRGYWSHRTVHLDGRPVEVVPAQVAFSAVPVPAGRHTIEWRETVPGIEISRWGPVLFVLMAAGLAARDRRTRRPA
jgi:hypothetical protein